MLPIIFNQISINRQGNIDIVPRIGSDQKFNLDRQHQTENQEYGPRFQEDCFDSSPDRDMKN